MNAQILVDTVAPLLEREYLTVGVSRTEGRWTRTSNCSFHSYLGSVKGKFSGVYEVTITFSGNLSVRDLDRTEWISVQDNRIKDLYAILLRDEGFKNSAICFA